MKKYLALVLTVALCTGVLTGCGGSKAEYLKDLNADKYVTLGQYIGIEVSIPEPEVSEEKIEETIASILESFPMGIPINGPSETGDMINIDFVGKIDQEPFDGGSAEGYDYTLGSYQVIADLEEGMHGMSVGDVWDIPVVFPETYHSPTLAGQAAVFTVTMNSIERPKAMTAITDEYAEWFTSGVYTTVDELIDFMRFSMLSEEINAYNEEIANRVNEAVIENAKFKKLPEGMVKRINDELTNVLTYYASMYNVDLRTYLMMAEMLDDSTTVEEVIREQAEQTTKTYLVFQAIADLEGLNVTDEEVEDRMEALALNAGMSVEDYREAMNIDQFREFLMLERVSDFLVENAVVIN